MLQLAGSSWVYLWMCTRCVPNLGDTYGQATRCIHFGIDGNL